MMYNCKIHCMYPGLEYMDGLSARDRGTRFLILKHGQGAEGLVIFATNPPIFATNPPRNKTPDS